MMDAEVAKNIKAQMQAEEKERLARLKEEETNIALFESRDNTQAVTDADCKLAARLQEEERGELSIKEKSRLFVKLMDKRKNILQDFELKRLEMLFSNTMKWIEAFVPMDTELVKGNAKVVEGSKKAQEGSSKRAADNLEQEDANSQRIEEKNETAKLKRCLEIIPKDDDVIIEETPLSSKSPTIVDYKTYKEGRKSFIKIIRADGNSQSYLTFGKRFKNVNREDLEVLWSIVKARFKKTNPIDDMDNLLFQTLKTMFEHHV
nr:hypothetical protein [Tanacetum cinerariifolium]